MDIIVCIKQVVAGDRVKIDPGTYSLVRSAEFSYINPFDLFALEMAVQLKKEHSGSITAVTMGPKISEEVLWEALTLGADWGVLLSDPRFSASDTLVRELELQLQISFALGGYGQVLTSACTKVTARVKVRQLLEACGLTVTYVKHPDGRERLYLKRKDQVLEIPAVDDPA